MCTITAQQDGGRLLVTMNRDEVRGRAPEQPPTERGDLVYPVDGQAGGTWIGVNRRGVCACIANLYPQDAAVSTYEPPPALRRTRGEIVPDVLDLGNPEALRRWMTSLDARLYPPFTLLVFAVGKPWMQLRWTGQGEPELQTGHGKWFMLSSSSWNTDSVLSWRRRKFEQWLLAPRFMGTLPTFHLLQPRDMEEWAPLMSRDTAHTRSITQVETDSEAETSTVRHWPRPSINSDASATIVTLDQDNKPVWEI